MKNNETNKLFDNNSVMSVINEIKDTMTGIELEQRIDGSVSAGAFLKDNNKELRINVTSRRKWKTIKWGMTKVFDYRVSVKAVEKSH